ncbi:MAG: hypothetical protein HC836_32935 [Richelia sp. RM2_1_2]|nr:hypothetical protein [Richelia sp. RM2_1_2]
MANEIIEKLVRGRLDQNVYVIEERIKKIAEVGVEDDNAVEIFDNIEMALRKEFREPISTGIKVIDEVTGGGLGKGEIGVVLAPTGAGKSTILTQFANNAYNQGKNVLQLIFEDTADQIRRKHFAIWSGIPLSQMDDDNDKVIEIIRKRETEFKKELNNKLIVKRFSQETTTLPMIKDYILRYQKKHGVIFDLVILDYIDCVNSHKNGGDANADELTIIKSFEAMAAELNIPCWTAIQTNRSGIEAELIYAHNMGGNIKRAQKTHFLMSIARTQDQKLHNLATLQVLKARFAKDGYVFPDCIFNNDTLEIRATTDLLKTKSSQKEYEKNEPEKLNEKMRKIDSKKEEEPNLDKFAELQKTLHLLDGNNLEEFDEVDHDMEKVNRGLEKFREITKENLEKTEA